jgi:hypothetical protein
MKTKEEIYLDEVKRSTEQLGEKFGKVVMSDAIRKFTLNCLMKMEDQFRQPIVIKSVCLHEWDEGHNNVSKCKKCGMYSA